MNRVLRLATASAQGPNSMAEWELRIAEFRVFYNVEEQVQIVEIQRIGEKEGNTFLFRGQQEDL